MFDFQTDFFKNFLEFLGKEWNNCVKRMFIENVIPLSTSLTWTSPTPSGTILPISSETSLPRGSRWALINTYLMHILGT